ncbi:ATP synthase subunit beta, chloroplastic [Artemisia annua]|uniref:Uncharacterized protein ycf68 n=1 Tax=Artemisia annua TaxID=35608 RepID=A0A2U1KL25_ARTAN|nr:ATP synthase subunit beta, chloroplastic [Artemisia annua]
MGAGHARSRYLNRKEGDAEGRASDWSEVVTRSEQVDRIPLFTSPCPLCGDMGAKKGKRGMGALSHMDSSMCSSAPDPEMWIIQGTLAWRTPPVRTGVRSNVDLTFDSLVGSGRSGGDHHGSSLLENPYIPYQCMDSYLSSTGLEKAEIKWDVSIYLSLDSKWEQTCHGKEEGGNRHTWRAQYNGELYAAFGKDESLPKRNLLILSQLDGPAAPGKRIEEASDSFMHAPLGSGVITQLVELRSCNWVVAITEDRNMPLKDATETKMGCQERRRGRMGSWSDLVWIVHGRELELAPLQGIPWEENQLGPQVEL